MTETQPDTSQATTWTAAPRKRRRLILYGAAGVAAAGTALAVTLAVSGHPVDKSQTPACKAATAAQDAFVAQAVAAGYPDVPVAQGLAILTQDLKLLSNMQKAGCPGSTQIHTLPDG